MCVVARDWETFGAVAVEQSGRGPAVGDRCDAPHQPVDVLDTRVQAESAGRREPVRCVTGQEDPALAHRRCCLRTHPPRAGAEDVGVELGAGRPVDDLVATPVVVVVDGFDGGVDGMHEHPVRLDVVGDEHAGGSRIEHEVEYRRPLGRCGTQVRAEMDHQIALQERRALHLDPEHPAHTTARAVAADHEPTPDPRGRAGRQIGHLGHHEFAGAIDLGVLPLLAVAQLDARRGAQLVGEDRFEAVLRQVAQRRGRELEARIALALERQATDQVTGQSGDEVDVSGVGRVLAGCVDAVHVEPGLAADLVGACVDDVRSR